MAPGKIGSDSTNAFGIRRSAALADNICERPGAGIITNVCIRPKRTLATDRHGLSRPRAVIELTRFHMQTA